MRPTATAILAAISLALSACATDPGADPKAIAQQRVDQITIGYAAVRSAATLCTSGVLCSDPAVVAAVRAGLATADIAVAEAQKLILANATDSGAVTKYVGYAQSAIDVLAAALKSFGVKVA